MRVVMLTGAGVSAESGLPTFRGPDGLWQGRDPMSLATPAAFSREPETVWAFYSDRRQWLLDPKVQPNAAHRALVDLENALGAAFLLVTQNVDDLHQRAGSRRILPIHGELFRTLCAHCGNAFADRTLFHADRVCPKCSQRGGLRPGVVWFGEMPHHLDAVVEAVQRCTHFIAAGTSGVVYPAAVLVDLARSVGAATIEINPEPSGNPAFREVIAKTATVGLPPLCARLMGAVA